MEQSAFIDPACGMSVEPAKAAGSSEFGGTTYYFCSPFCKEKFDADPAQCLNSAPAAGKGIPSVVQLTPRLAPRHAANSSPGAIESVDLPITGMAAPLARGTSKRSYPPLQACTRRR